MIEKCNTDDDIKHSKNHDKNIFQKFLHSVIYILSTTLLLIANGVSYCSWCNQTLGLIT